MRRRTLGNTGIEVSELSLGGVFIASVAAPYEQAERTIQHAVERGIDFFDVAPSYPDSEAVLGRALAGCGGAADEVTISTKIGSRHGAPPLDPGDPDSLRGCVEQSLRDLRRDVIDLLLIHEADREQPVAWWPEGPGAGPVVDVLEEMKAAGKVRHIGIAGTTAYEMTPLIRSGRFAVVLTAFQYSLLFREAANELIPVAVEHGMGVVLGSPLMQGLFGARHDELVADPDCPINTPRREQFRALYGLVDELGMPLPELALRFAVSCPSTASVLTGALHEFELEVNIAAVERGPLPEDVLRRLDEIHAMVPFRPYRERPENPFLPPN